MPTNKELLAECDALRRERDRLASDLAAASAHLAAEPARLAEVQIERDRATRMLASTGERLQAFEAWIEAHDAVAHAALVAILGGGEPPARDSAVVRIDAARLRDFVDWARFHDEGGLRQFLTLTGLADPPYERVAAPELERGGRA